MVFKGYSPVFLEGYHAKKNSSIKHSAVVEHFVIWQIKFVLTSRV